MSQSIIFEINTLENKENGIFEPTNLQDWIEIEEAFDEVHEQYRMNSITLQSLTSQLKAIIEREPNFLDAYAHLGYHLLETNKTQSHKWYALGVEHGKNLIREGFSGCIPWGFIENRPFLRCHHGYITSLLKKSKYTAAAVEIQQHLVWNPNDNLGVRYLLGDAYYLAKQYDNAVTSYEENMVDSASNCYGLGLLYFKKKDFVRAVTCFRKGLFSNIYLGEILTGKISLRPRCHWHGSSLCSPDEAINYIAFAGEKIWPKEEKAILFLSWLMETSFILAEQSRYVHLREELFCETDSAKRGALVEQDQSIWNAITDASSQALIRKICPIHGKECWPWEAIGWEPLSF